MTAAVSAPQIAEAAVKDLIDALTGIDIDQAKADFESGNPQIILGEVFLIAQVSASDAGYWVPEAAQAAQWIALARKLLPVLGPMVVWADAQLPAPHKLQPGEVSAWGHTFTGSVLQGDFPK